MVQPSLENLHLRAATNRDRDAVRCLIFDVLAEYGLHGDPDTTDADLDDLEANYTRRGGWFDLLETFDGTLAGTIGLVPLDGARCELRKMYLRRPWRGRGLGKRLLEHALARARDGGFRLIELETASALTEAMALYRRYGFHPVADPEHLSPQCNRAFVLELAAPTDDAPPAARIQRSRGSGWLLQSP